MLDRGRKKHSGAAHARRGCKLLGAHAMRWRSNPESFGGLSDGVKRRLALTDAALMSLLERSIQC